MKIHYLTSSTVIVESNGVKILTDPWLTEGEYYGSWYHYPEFIYDSKYFEDIDYIYVSHIHPDHFSKATFKLLNKDIPVLIHCYESKFLKLNIERLGFQVIELEHNKRTLLKDHVYINILAADNCNPELCAKFMGCGIIESKYGSTQIDSLCVIDDGEFTVLNTNDCPYDLAKVTIKELKIQYSKIDFLLVGYGGAGPFPQCFILNENDKLMFSESKKLQFLNQGLQYINEILPKYVMPFAGKYVLGGKLAVLQEYRGVPEIEEAAEYFSQNMTTKSEVILLNRYDYFDLKNNNSTNKYMPTNITEKQRYINDVLSFKKMDYENDEYPILDEIILLLEKAYLRFEDKRKEINFISDTQILIKLPANQWCLISCKGHGFEIISNEYKLLVDKFVSYDLDARLLKNILQGPRFAHWNNAEIGSHITFERMPNIFERGLYHSMNFFHV